MPDHRTLDRAVDNQLPHWFIVTREIAREVALLTIAAALVFTIVSIGAYYLTLS